MSIEIELFAAPGCSRCASARKSLERVVQGVGDDRVTWRTVEILDELDYAVALGVVSAPSLAINGELVFTALPSTKKLRFALEERLAAERNLP
jgi:hypothetical protein